MARGKKKSQDAINEEVKLELTPMIDVTFLILIFFMCTLKFKTLEGKLVSYLPTDKGLSNAPATIEQEDAEIAMKVREPEKGKEPLDRAVTFYRRGSNTPFGVAMGVKTDSSGRVTGYKLDPPDTLEQIAKYLKDVRETSPDSKAKINAWPRVPHAYVVHILNMMIEAKFSDISYSGIPNSLMKDLTTGKIK